MTLCSAEQLKNGVGQVEEMIQNKICGFHDAMVWTVSPCPSGRRRTALPSCRGVEPSVYAFCDNTIIKSFETNEDCINAAERRKTLGSCIPNSPPLIVANL